MRRLLFGLIVVFSLLSLDTYAYDKYTTQRITTLDGLSQNDVLHIIQDSYGFMWIATNDGLCRYDGYEFRIFSIGDFGLMSNLIISIVEDRLGNIWVGTADKGLYCYLREKNYFYHYSELADTPSIMPLRTVRHLTVGPDGSIWGYDGATKSMIQIRLSKKSKRIVKINLYPRIEGGFQQVSSLHATNSKLYVGTNDGVFVFNPNHNNFIEVRSNTPLGHVSSIRSRGELLHILSSIGFVTLNTRTGRVKKHSFEVSPHKFHWQGDTLWVVTSSGVYTSKYNPGYDRFAPLELVEAFTDYNVNVITEDHAGGVWVGFHKAGIRRYELNKKPFMVLHGFGNDHVLPIFPTSNGDLFVGTEGSGLFHLEGDVVAQMKSNTLSQSTIFSIDYAPYNSSLYIATNRNLMRMQDVGGRFRDAEVSLHNSSVRIVKVDSCYLWMGLYNKGVLRQDLRNDKYVSFTNNNGLPSNIVRNLMQDREGSIWICTSSGISKIPSEERFKRNPKIEVVLPDSIGNHYAIPIMEDSRGHIWYGTLGYGLYRLSKGADDRYEILNITTDDGLASNAIKSIVEDDSGVIWVSTNRGLGALLIDGDAISVNNFDVYDGLQDYEFNELSAAKLPDGSLIFGGVAGCNYFNPDNFIVDTTQVYPVVTDFKLMGKSLLYDSELQGIAPDGLQGNEGIKLDYYQNSFIIKFAGLHFSNPSKYRYKYKLDGVDRTWVESSNGVREVSYSNLSPGRYIFYLNTANRDGVWCAEPLTMTIDIAHPFWMKWYAFVFYALLLVVFGHFIIHYLHEVAERRNAVALADIERQKVEEMLDMRTRFFTNISHEFRTPLTLILTPLQRLIEDEQIAQNPKWRGQLNTMAHNGNSLMRLINEFLSYTKSESGGLSVQRSENDFVLLTQRLFEQFQYWAEQRGLTLHCVAPKRAILMSFDQYLIEQVIYNLTSNAIKYTPEGGEITLAVEEQEEFIIFSIEDSGCGITDEMQPHLFERFYSRTTDASKDVGGSGVGLFLTKSLVELHDGDIWFTSEVGRGTTFYVKLPKGAAIEVPQSHSNIVVEVDLAHHIDGGVAPFEGDDSSVGVVSTLLIIDDNKEIVQTLRELFETYYKVITASDGADGWKQASKMLPDVIVSDVMMPKMNGLDLCNKIKGDATTSHIPVILLSAKSGNEDIAAGLRCAADAYCPKPFNNKVLVETVNSILMNRRKLANKFSSLKVGDDAVSQLSNYGDDATTNTDKVFLKRLTEYIESNVHKPDLVVNDLCNYMGITPLVLNKKLKSLVDMTANTLIRTIRLRRAAALLKTARYTVADVTYDVGFSDLRYFRECFKKEFGLLPQEYKDQSMHGGEVESKRRATVGDSIIDAAVIRSVAADDDKEE